MKAAVMRGKQRIEVDDVPTPEPGPDQVLVKIKYSALCGSDVHRFQYGMAEAGAIMGHEFCGTIAARGRNVKRWKEGDRVVGGGGSAPASGGGASGGGGVALPSPSRSRASANPRYSARTVGFEAYAWGGFAEYAAMDEWRPLPIPDDVTWETAVLAEPCSIAVHAVRNSKYRVGDEVVIMGAGPIGLLLQQVLQAGGARSVYVSEPAAARASAARTLGATLVLDPTRDNVVARIVELTGGLGAPIAFDCAAAKPTLQQGLEMVRRGGQVVVVSLAWEEVPLLTVEWVGREVEMKATYGSQPEDWQIVLDLMARGKVVSGPLITPDSFIGFGDIQPALTRLMRPGADVQLVLAP